MPNENTRWNKGIFYAIMLTLSLVLFSLSFGYLLSVQNSDIAKMDKECSKIGAEYLSFGSGPNCIDGRGGLYKVDYQRNEFLIFVLLVASTLIFLLTVLFSFRLKGVIFDD